MPSIEALLAFLVSATLLSLSPGPSNMYILARGVSQGPRAGYAAAGGLAIGSVIYVVASVLGIGALATWSPVVFSAVKIAGACYLLYLAWQYIKSDFSAVPQGRLPTMPNARIFRQSVIVELSNPKTALFFIAFLPQFADGSADTFHQQLLVLGILYTLIALCCDLFVATFAGWLGQWLSHHPSASLWQDRICAGLLGALGCYILYQESQSHFG